MNGNDDLNLVEVIAIRQVIDVAINCCFRKIHFEMDSITIANNLNGEEDRTLSEKV